LQEELVNNPEIGKLIKNSGGIRKFRWGLGHQGKSGGLRVICYMLTQNPNKKI
jgi:hypothetical protein